MPTETRPIPTLAKSAVNLAQAGFQNTVNQLGAETLLTMGLTSDEGWRINFSDGVAFREVSEPAQGMTTNPDPGCVGELKR